MPQLVVATMLLFGTNFDDCLDHLDDVFGRLDRVAGDIDHAGLHDPFRSSSASRSSGTFELRHSIATCWIGLLAIAGKICSYCRHSLPSVCLPVGVGLDAVAVADVHGGGAGQPSAARSSALMPQSETSSM